MTRLLAIICLALAMAAPTMAQKDEPPLSGTAARGLTGEVTIEFAGEPLRAKPDQALTAPIIVRVTPLEVSAGAAPRFRIEYIGTIAGTYDLRELIEHRDGLPASDLAPIRVRIDSELPANHGTDLFRDQEPPFLLRGHYRLALGLLAGAWLLIPIVVIVRRYLRRPKPPAPVTPPAAPTLADQLRPLVEAAMSNGLSVSEQGRLELLLLMFWRDRLGLGGLSPADAIARLRRDDEAGRLLLAVERWLHSRAAPSGRPREDLAALLEPYRAAPAYAEPAAEPVA